MLDEKYFKHIVKYAGSSSTHRTFVTDLIIAIGRLDTDLAIALRRLLCEADLVKKVPSRRSGMLGSMGMLGRI